MQDETWKDKPFVSYVLIGINVIVFFFSNNIRAFYELGTLNVEGVLINHEYGRFIWSMFLHSGVDHIFSNMLCLFFIGTMVEKEFGHFSYTFVYFLSGIGGGMFSLYMKIRTHSMVGSVGASGALFGLDGVLLAMVLLYRSPLPTVTPLRVILMIALSAYSGCTTSNVDNAAHLGGLFVGMLAGALICAFKRIRRNHSGKRSEKKENHFEY